MDGPKVCYIARQILSPPIEGHHVASKRMIEAAASAGIDTKVITIESGTKCADAPKNCVIVNTKINPRVNVWFFPSLLSAMDDLFISANIASWVKSSDCDLIHVLNVNKEAYLTIHKLLRVKKPLLMHFYHSPHVLSDDVFLIRNLALRAGLYGRVFDNHILTVNLSLYKYFIEKLGINNEHVHYAPYPVNTEMFKPSNNKEALREKYGLPTDSPTVVYLGSLDPVRGIFDLVRSFRKVSTCFNGALLYISHPHREDEETYEYYLHDLIRILKLQDNVVVRGPCVHVEELYNLADVVVLPFLRPYWVDPPLVLLEAMSSGSAVITTPVGSIGEVIQNWKNGILVEPGDPQILAKTIIRLIKNPRKVHEIAQNARKTVVQRFSYEAVGNNLLKIYDLLNM